MYRRRTAAALVAAPLVALSLAACGGAPLAATTSPSTPPSTSRTTAQSTAPSSTAPAPATTAATGVTGAPAQPARHVAPAGGGSAAGLLAQLPVAAAQPAGYERSAFRLWVDADHDGQDTRAEVLVAESTVKATVNSHGTVVAGRWVSAYDAAVVTAPRSLDVDHVVPLEEAWASGARTWNAATREAYANDLGDGRTLQAVSAHANRSKGDQDPTSWMPSNAAYRCMYVANWVAVKFRWHLSVDPAEQTVLSADLQGCKNPLVSVPARATVALGAVSAAQAAPVPAPTAPNAASAPAAGGSNLTYANCTAVRAAGKSPLHAGDPGYSRKLDRDGDGVACE